LESECPNENAKGCRFAIVIKEKGGAISDPALVGLAIPIKMLRKQ
jgi:hypothetical protein